MRNAEQIAEFVLNRIAKIYLRPSNYGRNAEEADTILHYFHELWAVIMDREEEYWKVKDEIHKRERCGAMCFATHYQLVRPGVSDSETVEYVVSRWRIVSERMGMSVPA